MTTSTLTPPPSSPDAAAPTPATGTTAATAATAATVRVWDLPTRAFHWLLAAAVAGALTTGEIGEPWMAWHFRLGQFAGGLLLFRLAWGVVGGRWSRFASFAPSPARIARYLRGTPAPGDAPGVGHNPLGALSVWAMLVMLLAQVGTGLFADDEISVTGPLSHLAGTEATRHATSWHVAWGLTALFVLLGLHLLAVGWYVLRRKEPILAAIWSGDKRLAPGTPASRDGLATRLGALVLAGAALAAVFGAVARWGA